MIWALCAIAVFIVAAVIFFQIPYSKTKSSFQNDVQGYLSRASAKRGVFTEQDIASLPELVQNHFRVSGHIGQPKMTSMTAHMSSVPLRESNDKAPLIIDYTLFAFADEPVRLAYIKTSMFGIPFEGYDSTQHGIGFMRGVIGKVYTLFNQTGPDMDKGQLITYLSESFFIPSLILSERITWEPIDAAHVRATITYMGISGSGVFAFREDGFVKSFATDERARISNDGKIDYPTWLAVYENFIERDGIFLPSGVKAIWRDDHGDLIYFDADEIKITFR